MPSPLQRRIRQPRNLALAPLRFVSLYERLRRESTVNTGKRGKLDESRVLLLIEFLHNFLVLNDYDGNNISEGIIWVSIFQFLLVG